MMTWKLGPRQFKPEYPLYSETCVCECPAHPEARGETLVPSFAAHYVASHNQTYHPRRLRRASGPLG